MQMMCMHGKREAYDLCMVASFARLTASKDMKIARNEGVDFLECAEYNDARRQLANGTSCAGILSWGQVV